MKLNVFGRKIEVIKANTGWRVFYLGEGIKREADLFIPENITEAEIVGYLADLCHEWIIGAKNSKVTIISN